MNADEYRHQAGQLRLKARAEESASIKAKLENLAECFLLLAQQVEKTTQPHRANATARDLFEQDRRKSTRARVIKSAKLVVGTSVIECVVRNFNDTGARVGLPDAVHLPEKVHLTIDGGHTLRPCRVVWRKLDATGLAFLKLEKVDQHRAHAVQLRATARVEESASIRAELERLAECYLLLAEQAEKKADTQEHAAARS